ncbi:dactylin [Anaeramoeba ignava]|uniref:Dactylin n=1 Tax=Anaeramoeba ignava TaxID=1746090 RepID=A0A9Q0RHN8_ANAIG|nr:dactylin [Anaeramoeba ignava]
MHLFEEKKEFPFETFQKLIQPKNINYKKLENLEQKNVNGNENEGDCFSWLPDEILLTIFSYLDNFYQIAICSSVNQQFYRGSQDWFTWKNMIGNHHQILDFKTLSIDNNGNIFQHGKLGLANIFTQKEQNYQENETNKLLLDSQNKLSQDLVKKPKEIFIQQINKFQKVMKDKQQIEKKSKRNQRIQGKVEILCTPFFVAMAFLCMLPIPLLLISLKLDSIIKSSWFLIYIPFFIALVYSFTGSFLMCLKSVVITDEHFLFRLFYQSSVIISVFLILLGLRTENIVKNLKLIYILIPVFLFFIIGWYNMIKTLQYEKDRLENRSTLFVDTYLLTFPLIMLFFLIVSLILLSFETRFPKL